MTLVSTFRPRSLTLTAAAAAAALTLSACSTDSDDAADDTAAPEITSTESPTPDTQTSAVTATDTTTVSSVSSTTSSTRATERSSSATESTSTSSTAKSRDENVLGDVRDRFSTLAPPEFFDQFDSCVAGGLSGSFDCSGDGIGQFQFFDSDSKAASTTQLLTELRSSRVVEDNGDRVVGWSTLGTSAIITVVDNREGQVMQQLISTDQEDPRQRIYDLGLAEQ
ncbi:hypothetical protein [Corynebacterium mucifaciens]|uniref:Cobalamin biosynthesis Mg chelatase CobN n=1 Tax=Corynebacterium mucifaciens TaxID=57171 RepID=A0A7X6LR84_9CORY|nr:hypothetical protein [Corynebacterium mucifaciens]NKY68848.1 hypothetical protein [Corynebacterium mucifaciens]